MNTIACIIGALLILLMVLLIVLMIRLHRKVAAVPSLVSEIVRRERAIASSEALSALQEAAAIRVGPIVQAIRAHEDELAACLRIEVKTAEARARVGERGAADTIASMGAASELVRGLFEFLDSLRALLAHAAKPSPVAPVEVVTEDVERPTTQLPRPPGLAPPGSADPPLPVEPAMKAAGLGPRPGPIPSSGRAGRPTLLDNPAPPPALAASNDGDRRSDDEYTVIGRRPSPSALAMTLPSMPAVSAAAGGAGR